MTNLTPAESILLHFTYGHLSAELQAISKPFHELAHRTAGLTTGPETTTALRKLLEAKDCAVRAARFETRPTTPTTAVRRWPTATAATPTIDAAYRAVLDCPGCSPTNPCRHTAQMSRTTYNDLLLETDMTPDTRPPGVLLAHEVVVNDTLKRGQIVMQPTPSATSETAQ